MVVIIPSQNEILVQNFNREVQAEDSLEKSSEGTPCVVANKALPS